MNLSDLLIDSLSRSRKRFDRALSGVAVEQANTQPAPETAPRVDSLSWLAWHTAREIDFQIALLAGVQPVWITAGHKERFALDLPDDTEDWRHTPELAAKVAVSDISVLTSYLDDAYAWANDYLRGLNEDDFTKVIDESWDPPVTLAARLVSIVDDAAQHSGQAVYTHRLLGLPG